MSTRTERQAYTKRWKRARREQARLVKTEQELSRLRQHHKPQLQLQDECAEEPELMAMPVSSVSSSREDRSSVASATWQCCSDLEMWDMDKPMDETSDSSMEMEMRAMRTSITRMAQRLDSFEEKMEQKMDELLMLLRSSQSPSPPSAPVEDMLLSPCSTVTELEEFDRSLGQQERREKMKLFLTTLGGSTRGTAIRRMLRRVATNDVLKQFSLRGRKAKKAFQDLTICRVITAAAQKHFPALTAADAENLIGQVLKFAPHRRPAEKD